MIRQFTDMIMAITLIFLASLGLQLLSSGMNDGPIVLASVGMTTWLAFRLFTNSSH